MKNILNNCRKFLWLCIALMSGTLYFTSVDKQWLKLSCTLPPITWKETEAVFAKFQTFKFQDRIMTSCQLCCIYNDKQILIPDTMGLVDHIRQDEWLCTDLGSRDGSSTSACIILMRTNAWQKVFYWWVVRYSHKMIGNETSPSFVTLRRT